MKNHAVFIDPSSDHFLNDRLFDINNGALNRDGTLLPFARLKQELNESGISIHTADKLRDGSHRHTLNEYWSLGINNNIQQFIGDDSIKLRGFIIMEPPLVEPELYNALPFLTANFDHVYIHNTNGDGYNIEDVNQTRLKNFKWPQPYSDVLSNYWNNKDRLNKLVVIAGNHKPRQGYSELYSKRIEAIAALSPLDGIDLFGRGWDRWWSSQARWSTYWKFLLPILKNYQGSCESKSEILSKYRFSLCFENMEMTGYVTEKIFDCLYAGTVPIYLGAPNIKELIPEQCFINMRNFSCYKEMYHEISSMTDADWVSMRECGRDFISSQTGLKYYNSLSKMFSVC